MYIYTTVYRFPILTPCLNQLSFHSWFSKWLSPTNFENHWASSAWYIRPLHHQLHLPGPAWAPGPNQAVKRLHGEGSQRPWRKVLEAGKKHGSLTGCFTHMFWGNDSGDALLSLITYPTFEMHPLLWKVAVVRIGKMHNSSRHALLEAERQNSESDSCALPWPVSTCGNCKAVDLPWKSPVKRHERWQLLRTQWWCCGQAKLWKSNSHWAQVWPCHSGCHDLWPMDRSRDLLPPSILGEERILLWATPFFAAQCKGFSNAGQRLEHSKPIFHLEKSQAKNGRRISRHMATWQKADAGIIRHPCCNSYCPNCLHAVFSKPPTSFKSSVDKGL